MNLNNFGQDIELSNDGNSQKEDDSDFEDVESEEEEIKENDHQNQNFTQNHFEMIFNQRMKAIPELS